MSDVRIVTEWHHGNDYRLIDVTVPRAQDALTGLDSSLPATDIAALLGRPNDVHAALRVEHSWYTFCQVWASDKRDARTILSDAREHDYHVGTIDSTYGMRCSYGCKCGRFPTDANYRQDLAIDNA